MEIGVESLLISFRAVVVVVVVALVNVSVSQLSCSSNNFAHTCSILLQGGRGRGQGGRGRGRGGDRGHGARNGGITSFAGKKTTFD